MKRPSNYDKQPVVQISEDESLCAEGWTGVLEALARQNAAQGDGPMSRRVVVECYPGVALQEVRGAFAALGGATLICSEHALMPADDLSRLLEPWLGDDPVFGRMRAWDYATFFDQTKVKQMRGLIDACDGLVLVYGLGAAYVAERYDLLAYCDVTRWEIQQRQRRHAVGNIGAANESDSAAALYKRAYFVDWRAADSERHRLFNAIDLYIDTNLPQEPRAMDGHEYRKALAATVQRPFRVVPFFDPGPWGGQWMRSHFDLPKDPPNFAWCFDCVPEENSLRFGFGGKVIETPALTLVHEHPQELLGQDIVERFGAEFPIRFDFLDTMEGGNLSLQVHPLRAYIAEHFGMSYTQDESYYMLDTGPDAVVYLGLKPGIDQQSMADNLASAQTGGPPFPADEYVNRWPMKKHDHVSIPAGTIHCSGSDSMVLEISATPYIFTFKLWDWGRLGLNGQPRPIHLDHGMANIQWDRDRAWVEQHLVNQVLPIANGAGWREESTGLHELEFIETRRHWFTQPVLHDTHGTVHVINLVEGAEIVVDSPAGAFKPFHVHYAETFIVPACVGPYRISPATDTDQPFATIQAYVRRQE